jgi:dihydropteroate synthase
MLLKLRHSEFQFPRPTLLMGVLNVTPDSFSDGGRFLDPSAAIDHGLRMIAEGAEILDIGGESTRPHATPVAEEEEKRRVIPVIQGLIRQARVPISIDTMKPGVAEAALDAGVSVVNDVAAHRIDDSLWRTVARFGAGYVAMHMQGTPQTMQQAPHYEDVVGEIEEFFGDRLDRLGACGVGREQVILDPGIGFGKTQAHNLEVLRHLRRFQRWNRPVLLGISRKSLIGQLTDTKAPEDRLAGSLVGAAWGRWNGVQLIRTHDVSATRRALTMADAIQPQQEA